MSPNPQPGKGGQHVTGTKGRQVSSLYCSSSYTGVAQATPGGVGRTGSRAGARRRAMSGYKAKRRAGEQAGRLVDTLRFMCKAAIENILEVHPVFLRVLTRAHGGGRCTQKRAAVIYV